MINLQPISNVLGILLCILGLVMILMGGGFYFFEPEAFNVFGNSGLITFLTGVGLWFIRYGDKKDVNKREGYLIVTLAWVAMVIFGSLPYYFSGVCTSFSDMIFESVSGFTTTGASIFNDIEALPNSILLWRSATQWIGGMGIIVLTVAILPLLGIGGIQLFSAEAPGPTSDKIHPRIQGTAIRLWLIYFGLTVILIFILFFEGMTWFDALNHSLTTMATGGFSTKNASIAYYDNKWIHYTIILFMIMAGTNYNVIYFGLKAKFKKVWRNDEFKFYIFFIAVSTIAITAGILHRSSSSLEESFRNALFQVVSIITTTGFVTDDYTLYSPFITTLVFVLLFLGACAGSTSGGIKIIRHLVFVKNSFYEFKRILHPKAMIRIKVNRELVPPRILTHILVFLLIYLGTFVVGTIIVATLDMDLLSAAGAVATCLGNVGPGIGSVGPVNNFAHVDWLAKLILSFIMLLGRLELFTVLVIFTPFFWKRN